MFSWFSPIGGERSDRIANTLKQGPPLTEKWPSMPIPPEAAMLGRIARAAAACQPGVSDPNLENPRLDRATAEAALKVAKVRERQAMMTTIK